ncbi:MAG: hypothetical protein MUF24_13805 [Chitinophagaceae bacterium]|jgi:hypothetical protein|nr:hypothetical protein [Chitinophagaceae bacterium]
MKTAINNIAGCLLLMLASWNAGAQAYQKDVESVDAIIKALYEVISGEGNEPRNWDRFRYLFAKDARLVPTSKGQDGEYVYRVLTPEEYITRFSSRTQGFYEWELSRKTESYGTIAHAFTTYATRFTKTGPVTNRGINSIQLFKDSKRYYILQIFWCGEDSGFSLPEVYGGGRQ